MAIDFDTASAESLPPAGSSSSGSDISLTAHPPGGHGDSSSPEQGGDISTPNSTPNASPSSPEQGGDITTPQVTPAVTDSGAAGAAGSGATDAGTGGSNTANSDATLPRIIIQTIKPTDTSNGCTISFEYLPDSVSFGTSSNFITFDIPQTSGRTLNWQHSMLNEVSLNVKVVAGCNNAVTTYVAGSGGTPSVSKKTRNSLMQLAKLLYSLTLPSDNSPTGRPPPTSQLTVGPFFSCIGAFTHMTISYNGPWDFDGSPTDMSVDMGFMPSEFYDSSLASGNKTGFGSNTVEPKATMDGNTEVGLKNSYAIWVGETETKITNPHIPQNDSPSGQYPTQQYPTTIPKNTVNGQDQTFAHNKGTFTTDEIAAAYNTLPENVKQINTPSNTPGAADTITYQITDTQTHQTTTVSETDASNKTAQYENDHPQPPDNSPKVGGP